MKEIERTADRIGESREHEREPEMAIRRINVAQIPDPKEETDIHPKPCEDNAKS